MLVEQASVGGRRIGGVRSRQLRPRPRPGMQSPSRRNLWSLTKTTFCAANQKSVAKIVPTTFSWLMSQAGKETGSSAAWLQDVLMNSVSGGKSPCQVCSMHRAGCSYKSSEATLAWIFSAKWFYPLCFHDCKGRPDEVTCLLFRP